MEVSFTRVMNSVLLGRERLDLEGMDVPFHEVAQRLINHSMPRHGALAAEGFRNDGELPVAAAGGPRTRMAFVLRAFVHQLDPRRLQRRELVTDGGFDRMRHGNTFRNGFTVTRAYTPAAA